MAIKHNWMGHLLLLIFVFSSWEFVSLAPGKPDWCDAKNVFMQENPSVCRLLLVLVMIFLWQLPSPNKFVDFQGENVTTWSSTPPAFYSASFVPDLLVRPQSNVLTFSSFLVLMVMQSPAGSCTHPPLPPVPANLPLQSRGVSRLLFDSDWCSFNRFPFTALIWAPNTIFNHMFWDVKIEKGHWIFLYRAFVFRLLFPLPCTKDKINLLKPL